MFAVLDGSSGDVLGVEISGGYTKDDVEAFKKAFEQALSAGHARLNVLVKMDTLALRESELGAFVEDGRYALGHMRQMRHLAVVGHGKLQAFLIKMDNCIFGRPKEELVEKFFDIERIADAWAFVRE